MSHVRAVAHGKVKESYILRMRVANFVADISSVVEYTGAIYLLIDNCNSIL